MKIDGREIAGEILEELKTKVAKLKKKRIIPMLAIILVGNDPASVTYVRQKELKAQSIGAKTIIKQFSPKISELKLIQTIQQFNNNSNIHGIIVQQPLPFHIDVKAVTLAINPKKDIDGFNPKSKFQSPIAKAVLKILKKVYIYTPRVEPQFITPRVEPQFIKWLKSKKIVVIGKGETGGKPIIDTLQKIEIQPLIVDSKTINHELLTKNTDIIISAVGKENIINSKMIKKGVILISVGLHKGKDGKLHGDYEEKDIRHIASFYTPTPGGVGPVNVAMLLSNLLKAVEN